MASRPGRARPRTFLFSDLRSYTAYVERAGDAAASRLLRTYRDLVRRAVAKEKGAEVKTEGDSFYVVFESSVGAVRCAVAIQRAAVRPRREPLAIGIGIHTGEATPFDRQYVGSAVNIAARLASAADAGEVLISDTVRGLIRTALRLPLADRGPLTLKGIDEPIRAYAIRVTERPEPAQTGAPPASAMTALRRGDLDAAARIGRAVSPAASAEDRCDALTALTLVAAAHGDIETALGRTEQVLALALRAPDRSWIRVAYGLRSWLYFLARQPGEALAELDRAFERPGATMNACIALLLGVTLGGSTVHVDHLRQIAGTSPERSVITGYTAVIDVLEHRGEPPTARRGLEDLGGPFLGAVMELQLSARYHGEFTHDPQTTITRAGGHRLAELILRSMQ